MRPWLAIGKQSGGAREKGLTFPTCRQVSLRGSTQSSSSKCGLSLPLSRTQLSSSELASRSYLGLGQVVYGPGSHKVERSHKGVSHATLVRRVVVNERLYVALEGDGVSLQSGPQDALGAREVGGRFGLQEPVLWLVIVAVGVC